MESIKSKFKAIIFDMDGTIIKTEHIWRNVTKEVLVQRGFDTAKPEKIEFLNSLSGMGMHNAVTALKTRFNLADSVEELIAQKIAIADMMFQEQVEFIEGFEVFHEKLQLHTIPTSIATNATPENLRTLATKLNFEKFFGANMYCTADVAYKAKPDPAVFLHAAQMLGVRPEECIVFEDSLPGFLAAKAAGMKCIAIKNSLNHSLLDKVHGAIESYHEAEEILKKI